MILCSACFDFTNISSIAKGLPDFCCQICIHNNVNGQGTLYVQSWKGNLVFYLHTQHVKRNYIYRDLFVCFPKEKATLDFQAKYATAEKCIKYFTESWKNVEGSIKVSYIATVISLLADRKFSFQVPNAHIIINTQNQLPAWRTVTSLSQYGKQTHRHRN